jgi:cytoskeletal protein CcmA (bactofilin family)
MAREGVGTPPEAVISIIGPGMKVVGDCLTDGTVRVEGTVEGSVKAGKAVVVGKQGAVIGDVQTQDAVISGRVTGTLVAESRLELQATCQIDGDVRTRRMQLEEGALLNGTVHMSESKRANVGRTPQATEPRERKTPEAVAPSH